MHAKIHKELGRLLPPKGGAGFVLLQHTLDGIDAQVAAFSTPRDLWIYLLTSKQVGQVATLVQRHQYGGVTFTSAQLTRFRAAIQAATSGSPDGMTATWKENGTVPRGVSVARIYAIEKTVVKLDQRDIGRLFGEVICHELGHQLSGETDDVLHQHGELMEGKNATLGATERGFSTTTITLLQARIRALP